MTRRRNAFTVIELIVVVAILAVVGGSMLLGGGSCIMGGCSGDQGSLLVNPLHNSTVVFKVVKSYAMAAPGEATGNLYRVFAQVVQDSDGHVGEETFEVRDSWLDGQMMSADIFGKLQDGHTYKAECRGERSGVASSFRGIVSVEHVAAPDTE